jgi:hypothetical protein
VVMVLLVLPLLLWRCRVCQQCCVSCRTLCLSTAAACSCCCRTHRMLLPGTSSQLASQPACLPVITASPSLQPSPATPLTHLPPPSACRAALEGAPFWRHRYLLRPGRPGDRNT